MKKGRPLEEVLREIEANSKLKEDYIVDTRKLVFDSAGEGLEGLNVGGKEFLISDIAHGQIADAINIPAKYYNRMREVAPELLVQNVNHWFQNKPLKRMVRTLGPNVRAFLSDRYRRLDNEDLIEAMLPILDKYPGMKVESCEITPSRFDIKAITEQLTQEVGVGDVVYGGVVLSNSEVGKGSFRIEPMIYRLVCKNGMIVPDYGTKRFHIGRLQETDELFAKLTNETIEADDKAFWLKTRDVLTAVLSEDVFGKIVDGMVSAKKDVIEIEEIDAVVRLANKAGLSLEEQKSVLTNLLKYEEPNKFGLSNAVTRAAQEVESYERATELEYLGAEIMSMSKGEWRSIAGQMRRSQLVGSGA